jgi:hypothetical protein
MNPGIERLHAITDAIKVSRLEIRRQVINEFTETNINIELYTQLYSHYFAGLLAGH